MSDASSNSQPAGFALSRFWHELRRRKVVRVAAVYMVTGWLIIQVADTTFAEFGIPDWAFRFVTLMVILGLPVAVVLAWALELTPDGIQATRPLDAVRASAAEPASLTRKRNWTAYAMGALLPTIIFGSLATFFYFQANNSAGSSAAAAAHRGAGDESRATQSIAVLPLVNMSSLEENAYFAGGIHEDVLTNLSRISGLQVISRTSMLRYAASDMTLRQIGDELGVDYIVEGSVRRIGNHVRVTVQLINARNDLHLWANNYERELVDVFATQSALAKEISDSLHLELQPESVGTLEGMPTDSVKAYDLYIKAEGLEKTEGETEENMVRRRALLEEAVAEDPDFVEAWAVLKRLYDLQLDRLRRRGWYVGEGDDIEKVAEDLRARSQRALDKALALDADNVETLLSRAVDHVWPKTMEEMQEQKAIFDRILATHPENAKAWYHLGHWHSHLDDFPEHDLEAIEADAVAAFEEALRLDPFNARVVAAVLSWYRDRGYQEDVTRLSERLSQIIPETADDRRLARVSWNFKRRHIEAAFIETADEAWIEEYRKGWQEADQSGEYFTPIFKYWGEADYSVFSNDKDRVVELSRLSVNLNESEWNPVFFSHIKSAGMAVLTERGDLDGARLVAQSLLEHEDIILAQDLSRCGCFLGSLAHAYAVTGDRDRAEQLVEQLNEQAGIDAIEQIRALQHVDIDRAVDRAFAELAESPNWDGFDEMAAYYLWHRDLLAHPRVEEHYVAEGKWIDYLAARVPEYAKYKGAASE